MKQGKNPNKKQKVAMTNAGLDFKDWLIFKNFEHLNELQLVHRVTRETKSLTLH